MGKTGVFREGLDQLGVGYVVALKASHSWWHHVSQIGSLQEYARSQVWHSPKECGQWVSITRMFRDGHREQWWALEVIVKNAYGPQYALRAAVVTTDPVQLPEVSTWYLLTNLPAPNSARAASNSHAPADLAELVRLYGLRAWVEQSYKQVKHTLGWAHYQVRSDRAIRRHWALVFCAFTFCWWQAAEYTITLPTEPALQPASTLASPPPKTTQPTASVLAHPAASSPRLARTLHSAQTVLERLLAVAPAANPAPTQVALPRQSH